MIKPAEIAQSMLGRWVPLDELGVAAHPNDPQEHEDVFSVADRERCEFEFITRQCQRFRVTVEYVGEL